jgi:hypothetical protein
MWLYTKHGFISIVHHEESDKLVVRTETDEAMQAVVRHLGGEHEIEPVMDGFCRFSLAAHNDAVAQAVAVLVSGIDYTRFIQATHFDFGGDPNFFVRVVAGALEVARIKPS